MKLSPVVQGSAEVQELARRAPVWPQVQGLPAGDTPRRDRRSAGCARGWLSCAGPARAGPVALLGALAEGRRPGDPPRGAGAPRPDPDALPGRDPDTPVIRDRDPGTAPLDGVPHRPSPRGRAPGDRF